METIKITSINKNYFQKSLYFLYPLLKISKYLLPENTYVAWENKIKTTDYRLICKYRKTTDVKKRAVEREVILKHPLLISYHDDGDYNIYTFDLENFKESWDAFMEGKYSAFPEADKKTIIGFFKSGTLTHKLMSSYLWPDQYFYTYSSVLEIPVEFLQSIGELTDKPKLSAEILTKDIQYLERTDK